MLADEAMFLSMVNLIAASHRAVIKIDTSNYSIEFVDCSPETEHLVITEIMYVLDNMYSMPLCAEKGYFYDGDA